MSNTQQLPSGYDEDLDGPLDSLTSSTQPDSQLSDDGVTNAGLGLKKVRQKMSSFAAVVSDLAIGESASRTHMLNDSMTLAQMRQDMSEMKAMISNNVRPSVAVAKKRTGGEYRVETGETITTGGRVYLLVIVTRIS